MTTRIWDNMLMLRKVALAFACTLFVTALLVIALVMFPPRSDSAHSSAGTIVLLISAVIILAVTLWLVPKRQISRLPGLTETERFDRENEARKTIAQVIGGLFLVAGFYSSIQTLSTAREGQITDRYTKSIEQLGSENTEIKLGGIYALERIAKDSERDLATITEVLSAYARRHTSVNDASFRSILSESPTEILAIASVIRELSPADARSSRWRWRTQAVPVDLHWTQLKEVDLRNTDLRGAKLYGSHLWGAHLEGAHLEDAWLDGADLTAAHLGGAHMERAHLQRAHVGGFLEDAHLEGADLTFANLDGAHLKGAHCDQATILTGVENIEWANDVPNCVLAAVNPKSGAPQGTSKQ